MNKAEFLVAFSAIFLLLFFAFKPLPAFSQTANPISSSTLLQATSQNITNNGPSIWQNMLPINLQANQHILPIDINHLTVINDPSHTVFLPTSAINPQTGVNPSSVIQNSTTIPFQETTSSSYVDQIFSSNAFTFPVTHGEITINNALQTLSNKTISGTENTLQDIPNSALVHASIKILGGNGILVTGGDAALGDVVTIANTASSSLNNLSGDLSLAGDGIIS